MKFNKKEFREFLVGAILGDGSLCGNKSKYFFTGHCESALDYLNWKESVIKNNLPVGINKKKFEYKTGYSAKIRQPFYKLFTTSHHRLTALYKIIYKDDIKRISNDIAKYFSEISLAVLFMDDGCKEAAWNKTREYKFIKSYKFSLGNFDVEDVKILQKIILDKFDIKTKLYLEHKKYPCLKITTKENRDKFVKLISKHIHKSMEYKIYMLN
jgi:hypothetical protein